MTGSSSMMRMVSPREVMSCGEERESDGEAGALPGLADDVDAAAVGFDDGLDDAEAEPRAFADARELAIGLVERLEDALLLGGGEANAIVLNDENGGAVVA